MSTFREPTPEEARMVAIQFLGQNLGALKELDKNIISRNPTLQGNVLKVNEIIGSIPAPQHRAPAHRQQAASVPTAVSHKQPDYVAPAHFISQPAPTALDLTPLVDVLSKINSNLEKAVKLLDK